jgi:branched-subunit amino acid transport protein
MPNTQLLVRVLSIIPNIVLFALLIDALAISHQTGVETETSTAALHLLKRDSAHNLKRDLSGGQIA